MRKYCRVILILALVASILFTGALAGTSDKVEVSMPEVRIDFTADADLSALQTNDVTAQLAGVPLNVKSLVPNEQGILYIFLLDVSKSIPDEHFNAAKHAIEDVCGNLREQDELALITCGSGVMKVLAGGETADEVSAALDSLNNDEKDTTLYDGADALADLAESAPDLRVEAVAISDGDDTGGNVTRDKLAQDLQNSGIALNALCVDTADESNAADFRELAEYSGGEFASFNEGNADELLVGMATHAQNFWSLVLTAQDVISAQSKNALTVDLGGIDTIETEVSPGDWLPDTVSPKIAAFTYNGAENFVEVKFSEIVDGAEDPACYTFITGDGGQLPVASVQKVDGETYRVYPADNFPQDQTVTLKVSGPKDDSVEANLLEECSLAILQPEATAKPSAVQPFTALAVALNLSGRAVLILSAVFVLAVAAILTAVLVGKRKRKSEKNAKKKGSKTEKRTKSSAIFVFSEDAQNELSKESEKRK
jgi:Mg-chelatase subunit ChlD